MKRRLALMAAVLLIPTAATAAPADLMQPNNPYGMDAAGINVVDNWINNGRQASLVMGSKQSGGRGAVVNWEICNNLDDCEIDAFKMLQGHILLPTCQAKADRNCVEDVSATLNSNEIHADHVGQAADVKVVPSAKHSLPAAGGVGLWEIAPSSSFPALSLAVHAEVELHYNRGTKKFEQSLIAVTVVPYKITSGQFRTPQHELRTGEDGGTMISTGAFDPKCAWVTEMQCGEMVDFPDGLSVKVALRASNELSGWLMGRVGSPEVSIEPLDSNYVRLAVSGQIMEIPKIFVAVPKAEGRQAQKTAFPFAPEEANVMNSRATNPDAAKAIDAFRALANDRSIGNYQIWSFFSNPDSQPCIARNSGFQGFVSTNASVYQGSPPAFKAGYLSYEVAGYHYEKDGVTPNLGDYNLVMKSSLARCLYGFSSAPVSATVSVLNAGEDQLIATELVRESDGWLTIAASGFTFSEKEIRVKLVQPLNQKIAKFAGSKTVLTSLQKSQIKAAVSKRASGIAVVCKASFQKTTQKSLATKRATAVCTHAKSVNKKIQTRVEVVATKSSAELGIVTLTSKG